MNTQPTYSAAGTARLSSSQKQAAAKPPDDVRTVVIYSDLASGRRAMSMLGRAIGRSSDAEALAPGLWRADLLDDAGWRAEAWRELADADLLVLSFATPAAFSSVVEDAVSAFLRSRHGGVGAILALFGPDDQWSIAIQEPVDPSVPFDLPVELASIRARLLPAAEAAA